MFKSLFNRQVLRPSYIQPTHTQTGTIIHRRIRHLHTEPKPGNPTWGQWFATLAGGGAGSAASSTSVRMEIGTAMIPHPDKKAKGGEDAYFVSSDSTVIGVADGVGGWVLSGVDPALYSRKLMAVAKQAAEAGELDPVKIMWAGFRESRKIQGSSTAVILVLSGDEIHSANLGDSGFMVVRDSQIVFRSKEQQHYFNCPFQLGCDENSDTPDKADVHTIKVKEGDVIVVATDGFFDNLFDSDILTLLSKTQALSVENRAKSLAGYAYHVSQEGRQPTPFGEPKPDDITVCVAKILNANGSQDQDIDIEQSKPPLPSKL